MQFRIGERLASVLTLVLFLVAGPAYAQQTESRIIGRGARFEQGGAAGRDRHRDVQGYGRHS